MTPLDSGLQAERTTLAWRRTAAAAVCLAALWVHAPATTGITFAIWCGVYCIALALVLLLLAPNGLRAYAGGPRLAAHGLSLAVALHGAVALVAVIH